MRSRTVRLLLAFIILSVAHVWAAASLKLGAVLPDWSEVRHGTVHSAATRLVEDYSAQVRHFCVIPEVFLLPSATSIEGAATPTRGSCRPPAASGCSSTRPTSE